METITNNDKIKYKLRLPKHPTELDRKAQATVLISKFGELVMKFIRVNIKDAEARKVLNLKLMKSAFKKLAKSKGLLYRVDQGLVEVRKPDHAKPGFNPHMQGVGGNQPDWGTGAQFNTFTMAQPFPTL